MMCFALFFYSSASGSTTFITEPYYREYFDAQSYIPSRTTTIYESDTPTTNYEGRFTTSHTKSYAKTVTSAAGLTVDLPSPDSGIGADAITPRDQNNMNQQVTLCDDARVVEAPNTFRITFHTNTLSRFSHSLTCHSIISINNFSSPTNFSCSSASEKKCECARELFKLIIKHSPYHFWLVSLKLEIC